MLNYKSIFFIKIISKDSSNVGMKECVLSFSVKTSEIIGGASILL